MNKSFLISALFLSLFSSTFSFAQGYCSGRLTDGRWAFFSSSSVIQACAQVGNVIGTRNWTYTSAANYTPNKNTNTIVACYGKNGNQYYKYNRFYNGVNSLSSAYSWAATSYDTANRRYGLTGCTFWVY